MNFKFTRLLSLFVVMFTMYLPTMASSYYSMVVATAVGEGKVYASKTSTNNPAYVAGSSSATNNETAQSAPTHTYYVYAQADASNEFVGWYDNAQCSGTALSTSSPYEVKVTANSNDDANPTTTTVYAKFRKVGVPILNYGTSHAYVNLSAGTYKNETLTTENVTGAITYESSNENVATVAADGTVTAKKNGSCIIKAKSGEGEGSYILTVIDDIAAGKTQIGNGDFEDWSNVTSSNHAPNNWNSFETATGGLASAANAVKVAMIEGGRPGSDGLYCADIFSNSVYGVVAQGNLTLGCINAGNMSAAHADNHNYSNTGDPAKSETIFKVPSAMKVWVKFVPGSTNTSYPYARISATVHDKYNYITYGQASDDTNENKAHAIAQAERNFLACEWTELTIPFEPTGNTTDGQKYIIVNFTTNAEPGKGQLGDHLYIDDIELVYPEPVVYNKYISVAVNGIHAEPVEAPIEVTYNVDSTIDFNLKNFGMAGSYVGNISVPNLAMDKDGNFSCNDTIQISEGDLEGVTSWIGPALGDIPVELTGIITNDYFYVHIDINVGYPVEVEVGDLANATVSVSNALVSTFCAPFTVAIPSAYQAYVSASTVTGVNNNVLVLESVANSVIPANTPVIIEAPMAATLPVSGIYVKGTPTAGLLTGVYEKNTYAPVGSYVLQNHNGKVGFYQVAAGTGQQPKVGVNRCYLTTTSGVKAFYFDEDDATGIVSSLGETKEGASIFNLAGQRISKIQKGINIINGKKILK